MSYYSNNNYHSNSNHHSNNHHSNNHHHSNSRNAGYNYNNSPKRGGHAASYVWQVSWYNYNCDKKYKAFTNKQQALIFMSKIKSNPRNDCVYVEKWSG